MKQKHTHIFPTKNQRKKFAKVSPYNNNYSFRIIDHSTTTTNNRVWIDTFVNHIVHNNNNHHHRRLMQVAPFCVGDFCSAFRCRPWMVLASQRAPQCGGRQRRLRQWQSPRADDRRHGPTEVTHHAVPRGPKTARAPGGGGARDVQRATAPEDSTSGGCGRRLRLRWPGRRMGQSRTGTWLPPVPLLAQPILGGGDNPGRRGYAVLPGAVSPAAPER